MEKGTQEEEDSFGTTPLPTSFGPSSVPVNITLDLLQKAQQQAQNFQQPQTTQLAVYFRECLVK